jgi:hypothetical protein
MRARAAQRRTLRQGQPLVERSGAHSVFIGLLQATKLLCPLVREIREQRLLRPSPFHPLRPAHPAPPGPPPTLAIVDSDVDSEPLQLTPYAAQAPAAAAAAAALRRHGVACRRRG